MDGALPEASRACAEASPRPASFRRQPSASSDTCLVNGELSTMAFNMIENSWKVRTICQQLDTIVAYILQNSIAL